MDDTTLAAPPETRRQLIDSIAVVLGRLLKRDLPELTPQTRLSEDLDLDSTSLLELLLELEDELAIEIDVEEIERRDFETIASLADLAHRQSTVA